MAGAQALKVLVTGSTGLIGSALVSFLGTSGHTISLLTRTGSDSKSRLGEAVNESGVLSTAYWNPYENKIDASKLEGHEAVVHLAGENIAGIWTAEKKKKIRDSRINGTLLLSKSLAGLENPPKVLVCASAVGYYGSRGDKVLTEESSPGEGLLADVCREWEHSAKSAIDKGIRVVHMRFGAVLSPKGGALKTMLIPFRMGIGGRIGSGEQYMSWIAIDDAVGAIYHTIKNESVSGAVNAVSPNPVTNEEFTKILGRALGRPTFLNVPSFAVRLLTGQIADEMLLASTRVKPAKLLASGYRFQYPKLEDALRHLL